MKTLLALVCLTLALPVFAQRGGGGFGGGGVSPAETIPMPSNWVPTPMLPSTQPQTTHGLIAIGTGSAAVRADTCYLIFQLHSRMSGGMGGGGMGGGTNVPDYQAEQQKERQAIADALRPFSLVLDEKTKQLNIPGMYGAIVNGNLSDFVSVTLRLNQKGEAIFGTGTLTDVSKAIKALKALDSPSYFAFGFSSKTQTIALKPLLPLAVKNGLEHAKSLAALTGASRLRLVEIRELGSTTLQPVTVQWPTDGPLRAPEQTLSTSVMLLFAPLDVIISTKK